MTRIASLAPIAVAVLLAGCGSSSSTSASSSSGGASSPAASPAASGGSGHGVVLSESEFKITPANPAVASAGTITITVNNTGSITHALAVQTPAGIIKTGQIAPGASATLKVKLAKAGRFVFYCPIDGHRQSGMQGMLVVGSSGGSAASGAGATTSTQAPPSGSGY